MISDRSPFKAVALDGKIWVFRHVINTFKMARCVAERYDSQSDSWYEINRTNSDSKDFHGKLQLGKIVVHGGDQPFSRVFNARFHEWDCSADRCWWRNREPELGLAGFTTELSWSITG
ncbi:unnamed protein product [Calypogeia fissa]